MERNIESVDNTSEENERELSTSGGTQTVKNSGETVISTRQAEITNAIKGAEIQFKSEGCRLIIQLSFWLILCFLIVRWGYNLVEHFMDKIQDINERNIFDNFKDWQIYFYVFSRVTLVTGLFSIASFLLKMFRSTYHIYQSNRHRLNIIKALPSFMAASKDPAKEEEILAIILKTVIKQNNTGLISKESDIKSGVSIFEKIFNTKSK